jgi:tetrahydromethanopterin S-methyltransferase subunit G
MNKSYIQETIEIASEEMHLGLTKAQVNELADCILSSIENYSLLYPTPDSQIHPEIQRLKDRLEQEKSERKKEFLSMKQIIAKQIGANPVDIGIHNGNIIRYS